MKGSSSSRGLVVVMGLAVLALGAGFWWTHIARRSAIGDSTESQGTSDATAVPTEAPARETAELREQGRCVRSGSAELPVAVTPGGRSAAAPQPQTFRAEPTPYTRQLIAGLTNLDFSHGPITKEQAEQWKQSLQALTAQGAAAVPAIREFREQNQDLNFTGIKGNELLGQPSLRMALINACA